MAEISPMFASIVNGSLGALTGVKISKGVFSQRFTLFDTTGSGDGATEFKGSSKYVYALSGSGWYRHGGNYAVLNGGAVVGGKTGRVSRATVVKRLKSLTDVTAAGDAAGTRYFVPGLAMYYGNLSGYLKNDETPLAEETGEVATLTLPLGLSTSISGAAVFESVQAAFSFKEGGPVSVGSPFRFSGVPTISANTPLANGTISAELSLDNGQTVTGSVILNQVALQLNYADGAAVPVSFAGVFTGEVVFEDGEE
jgi:hypothetical protein